MIAFQLSFIPTSFSQIDCGGQSIDVSCLNYPNETYLCIDGDVESHTQYGTTLLVPSSAETNPQFLLVKGKISFTEDYEFAPGSDIVFLDNNSGFKVLAGKKLTLSSCSLHGCSVLWAGVEVSQFAELSARNNSFQDAKAAIILRHRATFEVVGNTFAKNVCGILATRSDPSFVSLFITLAGAGGISGNSFLGGDQLLEAIAPKTIDSGLVNENVNSTALNYPYVGIWLRGVLSLTIGHLKGLFDGTNNIPLNTFQNFGTVQEVSPDAPGAMGIRSSYSNVEIRNSTFSNIGHYNPLNTSENSNAAGISTFNDAIAIPQTTIIGTKNSNENETNTFSNCYNDIHALGTDISVTNVTSYKSGNCIDAYTKNSLQNPIKIAIKNNDFTFYHGRALDIKYFRPISLNVEQNFMSDNDELYDPVRRSCIRVRGNGWALQKGSRIYDNLIKSNSVLLGGAFEGILLNKTPYIMIVNNTIEDIPASTSNLFSFTGIKSDNNAPSNGVILHGNSILGAKTDYEGPSGGIFLRESINTHVKCNTTDNINTGILFLGNCDNANLSKNTFGIHNVGLSLGSTHEDLLFSVFNAIGLQHAKENIWPGMNSQIEAFVNNEESAMASIFEINSSDMNSQYWPNPRKVGDEDDMGIWFQLLPNQEPADLPCYPSCPFCKIKTDTLAHSDTKILDNTFLPPLGFPAMEWEAKWQFADRLNRNEYLQNISPDLAQYFQNTYNDSYSHLNRIYQDYQNVWQQEGSLATTVNNLKDTLQILISQRLEMDRQLSEKWEENELLHTQMANADIVIENTTIALSDASEDLLNLINQKVADLLLELEDINCQESYGEDMKSVIKVILESHFTEGNLTSKQSSAMKTIAEKCRYAGGYAVVMARGFFEPQESYEQDINCVPGKRFAKENQKSNLDFRANIYPNPVSSLLTLNLDKTFDSGVIQIYNNLGLPIKSVNFYDNIIEISVAELNGGLYFIEIQSNGKPSLWKTFVKVD